MYRDTVATLMVVVEPEARQFGDADYGSVLASLNLGIHEAGHLVLRPFGSFQASQSFTVAKWVAAA